MLNDLTSTFKINIHLHNFLEAMRTQAQGLVKKHLSFSMTNNQRVIFPNTCKSLCLCYYAITPMKAVFLLFSYYLPFLLHRWACKQIGDGKGGLGLLRANIPT